MIFKRSIKTAKFSRFQWRIKLPLTFLFCYFLLTGCTSLPPAIENPPSYDLSYQQAVAAAGKFKNAPVRWGGTIIEVENEPSYSALQVLSYPLTSYGRPELDEQNQGRFVVKSPTFLDPEVYKKNTPITVAGTLGEETERKIGNKNVRLPLVNVTHIHIWQENDYYRNYGGYGGFTYGSGYWGFPYGGFYGYYPYYPGAFYNYSPYWGGAYQPYYRRW
jgi:outer membrane lipoprotein